MGAGLGVVVAALAYLLTSGEPSPGLWEDLAVAAGARPAATGVHTLWICLASFLLRDMPYDTGYCLLRWMGPVSLGVFAYLFAGLLQMLLPDFLRAQLAEARSHRLIRRFIILPVAALFVLSEPIWRLGAFFTPDTFHVLLALFGIYGLIRFRRTRARFFVFGAYIAMTVLAAEDILGVVMLTIATGVMTRDAFQIKSSGSVTASTDATLYAFLQRSLTVTVFFVFLASLAAIGWFFVVNGGMEANSFSGPDAIIAFFLDYFRGVPAIATQGGWLYFVGLGIMPLVIALIPLRRSVDVEKILDYRVAVCYIMAGLLAFLQLSNFRMLWLWQNDKGGDAVTSQVLLVGTMLMMAITLAQALAVLLVEVYFRDYERFAEALFYDAPEGERPGDHPLKLTKNVLRVTWIAAISVPYILVALSLGWRGDFAECAMSRAVGDYVRLAADDCHGSPIAITDGSLDAGLELEMFCRGEKGFKALSMMGDRVDRETYLRRRGETEGSEDWTALGISTAAALRDWVRMKSPRATNLTVQIGFELWRHDKLEMPQMGATAARTDGIATNRVAELVKSVHELGERMLELHKRGAPFLTSDPQLRRMWNFALWRIARAARMRSDAADRVQDVKAARAETDFADRLDDANPSYQEVRRRTEWVPRQIHARFTPREGLKFALQQADFILASSYARQILASNPNDFRANFAMGMYYVTAEQYTRAAKHLELAAKTNPKDPASLNNLATVEMQLGRLEDARKHAEAARKLAPDQAEIKRTYDRINREIEKIEQADEEGLLIK